MKKMLEGQLTFHSCVATEFKKTGFGHCAFGDSVEVVDPSTPGGMIAGTVKKVNGTRLFVEYWKHDGKTLGEENKKNLLRSEIDSKLPFDIFTSQVAGWTHDLNIFNHPVGQGHLASRFRRRKTTSLFPLRMTTLKPSLNKTTLLFKSRKE